MKQVMIARKGDKFGAGKSASNSDDFFF